MPRLSRLITLIFLSIPATLMAQGPPPAKVAVAPATLEAVRDSVTLVGTVAPFQTSTVAALTAGRVLTLKVRNGDRVRAGDPLVLLDTTRKDIDRRRVSARLEATRVRLSQTEADLTLGQALLPSRAISADVVDTRERTVLETRLQLTQEQADLAQLSYLIEQATIRAPFAGVVTEELVQAGEWVAEGGGIAKLVDLSTARIRVWVPESMVGGLTVGDTVTAVTEGGTVSGRLHAIIPDGDPNSRTFPVEARVDNANGKLLSGMLARVTFALGKAEQVLTIPADAVVTRGRSSHIWKVVGDGGVKIAVTLGRRAGERVEVIPEGELTVGDRVVTRGNERVRPGQPLLIME